MQVGIDIIEIARIKKAVTKNPAFWERILTPEEKQYCQSKGELLAITSLAGRFAAKEAILKCLGTGLGEVSWQEMEIKNDSKGRPKVALNGHGGQVLEAMGLKGINLSISHCRDYATAVAIGVE